MDEQSLKNVVLCLIFAIMLYFFLGCAPTKHVGYGKSPTTVTERFESEISYDPSKVDSTFHIFTQDSLVRFKVIVLNDSVYIVPDSIDWFGLTRRLP